MAPELPIEVRQLSGLLRRAHDGPPQRRSWTILRVLHANGMQLANFEHLVQSRLDLFQQLHGAHPAYLPQQQTDALRLTATLLNNS